MTLKSGLPSPSGGASGRLCPKSPAQLLVLPARLTSRYLANSQQETQTRSCNASGLSKVLLRCLAGDPGPAARDYSTSTRRGAHTSSAIGLSQHPNPVGLGSPSILDHRRCPEFFPPSHFPRYIYIDNAKPAHRTLDEERVEALQHPNPDDRERAKDDRMAPSHLNELVARYYYSNCYGYNCNSRWYDWGRWIVVGVVIFIVLLVLLSCT